MSYKNRKLEVWNKAKPIKGKNPKLYRQDKFGNEMYFASYGKNTSMGWTMDHSKPQSKGGTHHLNNLQAMNTKANRDKSNQYPHRVEGIDNNNESSSGFWVALGIGLLGAFIMKS